MTKNAWKSASESPMPGVRGYYRRSDFHPPVNIKGSLVTHNLDYCPILTQNGYKDVTHARLDPKQSTLSFCYNVLQSRSKLLVPGLSQTYATTKMAKPLVVFGATGQQGGSLVSFVLKDAELSKQYNLRAVSRDPSSSKSEDLKKKGVEVIKADLTDKSSLHDALKGAHTVFAMTTPSFGPDVKNREITEGKAIADVAVAEKVQYIIFSTLPSVSKVSGGKYTKVTGFDAKAEVEEYIRTLPIRSAFFAPGSFMQNCQNVMAPRPAGGGAYMIARHVSGKTQLPLIDTVGDTGKYVGAILAEPDKYEGKTFCAASRLYSLDEVAQTIAKVSGKAVTYKQIPEEDFRMVLPPWADMLIEMMLYQQDFGYYGPKSKELVAWAAENARGKVHTFEEYLRENPLQLQ